MEKLSVVTEVRELKNQIAYAKNLGFFFGAGTSCALKVPDVATLTSEVAKRLVADPKKNFDLLQSDLTVGASPPTIEDILNHCRRIRELTKDQRTKVYVGVTGEDAKNLDAAICRQIFDILSEKEEKADLSVPGRLLGWLSFVTRNRPKEIFTTNYDLILEKALEANRIPYFDGFVGSYEPFFWQESISSAIGPHDLTVDWIRIWKIHGSLNWFWRLDPASGSQRISRVGKFDKAAYSDKEIVIYPSREKYDSSRKQPFLAYFDRLHDYLQSGELLFLIVGYSFSDQHINEVIFNGARQNKRLACVVFCFKDSEVETLAKFVSAYPNITVIGPSKAILNGSIFEWAYEKAQLRDGETSDLYFNEKLSQVTLGDFNALVPFLLQCSGRKELGSAAHGK